MNNRYVYIDDDIFLTEYVFTLIEEIHLDDSIIILIDDEFAARASDQVKMKNYELGFVLESYYTLITEFMKYQIIDTSGNLNFSILESFLTKDDRLEIYTSRRTIVETIHTNKSIEGPILFFNSGETGFEPWNLDRIVLQRPFVIEGTDYHENTRIDSVETVYSPRYGYLRLNTNPELMHQGGEGVVYKTYHNFRCKLYFEKYQSYFNHKKLKDMLSLNVTNDFIVWPKDVVYHNNTFVGYIMDDITNAADLDKMRDEAFNRYSYKERINIVYEFLKHIKYLHDRNIIIGDMKFENVLVKNDKNVFIIDTGSFQVLDYPCPVFTKGFTNISYTSEKLKNELRQIEDEYFAINKIIFEIIMGKSPFYSTTNGMIDNDDLHQTFGYQVTEPKILEEPIRQDLKHWYNLPKRIREYFFFYFTNNTITYVDELMKEFELFINKMEAV
jgi:hypothetical protein